METSHDNFYCIDDLDELDIDDLSSDNLGWAIAERFPTEEYKKVKAGIAAKGNYCEADATTELGIWQEDESFSDYIDRDRYGKAPIVFDLIISEECFGYNDDSRVRHIITLYAESQEDIDYIQSIVEETVSCDVKIRSDFRVDLKPVWFRLGCTLKLTEDEIKALKEHKDIDMKAVLARGITAEGDTYPVESELNLDSEQAIELDKIELTVKED